ncbi:MAG: hypothetical protein KatS3mg100_003 [Candidatus Parcubacteria bacterium]|nr:MAG: hypothetical protein KatS3mg100_003 [Candidatus Parcubacteria bacterium]
MTENGMKHTRGAKKYVVSPYTYLLPGSGVLIEAVHHTTWRIRHSRFAEALFFFLRPHTLQEGVKQGFPLKLLQHLVRGGVLTPSTKEDPVWVEHNWNRAAFLLFSQRDLPYLDAIERHNTERPNSLIELRRQMMKVYRQKHKPYPERYVPTAFLQEIPLTPPQTKDRVLRFDLLKQRQSERSFRETPIPVDTFSAVLFCATQNLRAAECTKKEDPFFLLNSFYAWVLLYVYVQSVEGIPRGLYYYDPIAHRLLLLRRGRRDQEVAKTIQGQFWFRGGGFCVFVGVQWERYAWLYRHSRAYLNLLIQLGELAQEFTAVATSLGLGSWLTPAVAETRAKRLCCLEDRWDGDIVLFMKFGFSARQQPPIKPVRKFAPEQDRQLFYGGKIPVGLATSDFDLMYEQAHLVLLGEERVVAIRRRHGGFRLVSLPKQASIVGLRLINVPEREKEKLERQYHVDAQLCRIEFYYHRKKFAHRLRAAKNFKRFVKRYACEVTTRYPRKEVLQLFARWQQSFRERGKRVPSDTLFRALLHPKNRARYGITFVYFTIGGKLVGVKVVYPYSRHDPTHKLLVMRYKLMDHAYVGLDKFMDYTIMQLFPEYDWITDGGDFVDEAFKSRYKFKLRQRKPDKQVPLYTMTILGPKKPRGQK